MVFQTAVKLVKYATVAHFLFEMSSAYIHLKNLTFKVYNNMRLFNDACFSMNYDAYDVVLLCIMACLYDLGYLKITAVV